MALPVDFMERIVDWPGAEEAPGFINAHWQRPDGKGLSGLPYKTLNDFMSFVQYAAVQPWCKELYFCTSKQRAATFTHNKLRASRHADAAMNLKALWLDIDVKPQQPDKNYTSFPEAMDALNKFVNDAGLPKPSAMIHTGGGLHVYWISLTPLPTAEWKPYGEGLKKLAAERGLKADPLSGDAARIMRVPGTFNNKIVAQPRPVKLLFLQDSYDFATTPGIKDLPSHAPVTVAVTQRAAAAEFELPAAFAAGVPPLLAHLDPTDVLGAGLRGHGDMPLDPKNLFQKCQHFRDSFLTHGVSQSQGLWMLNGLASTWLDDGRAIFHTLSKGYPTYTKDETDTMYDRKVTERAAGNLGWPSCTAFEGQGAKCKGCPFYGKIRSPLNLAERPDPPPKPIPLAQQVITQELDLPNNYIVDGNGFICKVSEKHLKDGGTVTEQIPLFLSKLRNFRPQGGEERRFIFETSLDMNNWGVAALHEGEDFVNETTIMKALRKWGVKPNLTQPNNGREILIFMTSFMARLDAAKQRQQSITFGWLRPKEGGEMPVGFAYGGELVMNDGTRVASGFGDPVIQNAYEPKGTEDAWWKLHDRLVEQKHIALEVITAASFGAPLQFGTAQYNGTFCAFSSDSGSHKSTSVALGASVWGCPILIKEKPSSSAKGIIKTMGIVKNLPIYWDEVDDDTKMKGVAAMVSEITEGGDGSKLKSNRDFHHKNTWQTMVVVCSNRSLVETIQATVKDTDAKLERVFEVEVEKRPDSGRSTDFDDLVDALNYNYGHMGVKLRNLFATQAPRLKKQVKDNLDRFLVEVAPWNSKERFRGAMAAVIYTGAQIANELGCKFHTEEIWEYLKDEFVKQRRFIQNSATVAGSAVNVLNMYSQYLNTVHDNILHVTSLPNAGRGTHDASVYISGPNSLRKDAVYIRMSVTERVIDISKPDFLKYMEKNKLVSGPVIRGFMNHWNATEVTRVNLALGSGLPGGARVTAIRIPVPPGSPFEPDLVAPLGADQLPPDYTPPDLTPTQPDGTPLPAPAEPVTATVTPATGIAAAMAQAATDLSKVRKAS